LGAKVIKERKEHNFSIVLFIHSLITFFYTTTIPRVNVQQDRLIVSWVDTMIATILLSGNVSQAKVNFKMTWLDEKQMLAIIYIYIIKRILAELEFIFNNIILTN
jgi:hypothetical protein